VLQVGLHVFVSSVEYMITGCKQ